MSVGLLSAFWLNAGVVHAQALPDGWYEREPTETAPTDLERPVLPGRLVLQVGGGVSVRTQVDTNFRQERLAPAFMDLTATWITRGDRPRLRFGPSLELSTNLTYDGPAVGGVRPFTQWVVAPGFTVRAVPSGDPVPLVVLELRPAVMWVVSPARTWGFAATIGAAFMVRASLGLYLEATASIVAGGGTRDAVFTRPAMISLEAGVRVDVERLP
ncbi:MAG: hypothetical protein R3B40_01695 [Polyangiales bacterium]